MKELNIILDNADMFLFVKQFIKRRQDGSYFCDGEPARRSLDESIPVSFYVDHTYQIFNMLKQCWGGWNDCPECETMQRKAQEWQERYGAELIELAYDTLTFSCKRLSENEAEALWKDICLIAPNSQDIPGNDKKNILENRKFTLWWD